MPTLVSQLKLAIERTLGFFEAMHGARAEYLSLGAIIFTMEGYLAYRAAFVAFVFFSGQALSEGAWPISVFTFLATMGSGYILASHPSSLKNWRMSWMILIAVGAEWFSVAYLVYHQNGFSYDIPSALITASYCLVTLLPFGMGVRMERAHGLIGAEKKARREAYVTEFRGLVEDLAMKRLYKIVIDVAHEPRLLGYLPSELRNDAATITGEPVRTTMRLLPEPEPQEEEQAIPFQLRAIN